MKVGDLVKYESRHTGLQDLTGLVIEIEWGPQDAFYQRDPRVRVFWSSSRPAPIRWDWAEELRVVNESR